jgi:DNA replication protein DnaC
MRTQLARFPFVKGLEVFDFTYQPSIDRKQIQTLTSCHFIEHGENLVIPGPPVSGRRIWRSASASRRSSTATACCSPRPLR